MKGLKLLTGAAIIAATLVILLGAYTRLTDAGLGCPDWPGCYGAMTLPDHHAQTRFPDLVPHKARNEMVHRYAAGLLASLILALFVQSWRRAGRPQPLPLLLLGLVLAQATLGMLTVTKALHPLVVLAHLLGGFAILTGLWLYRGRLAGPPISGPTGLRRLGACASAALLLQIALGGWTSANYAAMACVELPVCQGQWQQELALAEAFTLPGDHPSYEFGVLERAARQTIHISHRAGALLAALLVGSFALGLLRQGRRRLGTLLLTLLLTQLALGISNVVLTLPLANALAHDLVAAHLLVVCTLAWQQLSALSPRLHLARSPL